MGVKPPDSVHRIKEIDFVKCVLIVLMIAFHLVFIGDSYPYAKQVVYTFHMPGFLVISGYLLNVGKPWRKFLHAMLWIFIPYAVMESGYTVMAAVLPIREHIDLLTFSLYMDKLLLHPLGPYWYLHTLLLCSTVYYGVAHCRRIGPVLRLITVAVLYVLLWRIGIVSLSCALYFLGGAAVRSGGMRFTRFFRPTLWALLPMAVLAFFPVNMDKGSAGGVFFVYLSVCFADNAFRWTEHPAAVALFARVYSLGKDLSVGACRHRPLGHGVPCSVGNCGCCGQHSDRVGAGHTASVAFSLREKAGCRLMLRFVNNNADAL